MTKPLFRPLQAEEIEVRLSRCSQKGAFFLLYKDARCDMAILDETVGPENWQRRHEEHNGNLFCSVGINSHWQSSDLSPHWVWKEDAGSESNTEAEKGHASDSFKRACVNWGIGRELYTKINIFIPGITKDSGKTDGRGKPIFILDDPYLKLSVSAIESSGGKITHLSLSDAKTGAMMFIWGCPEHDEPLICSDCGNEIKSQKKRNGEIWTAKDIAEYTMLRFGASVCAKCAKLREKAE